MGQKAPLRVQSPLQSLRMVIVPAIMTVPAVLLWHWCYVNGWHSTRLADEPIVNAILPGALTAHVLIVGFVFSHQMGRYAKIMETALNIEDSKQKQMFIAQMHMVVSPLMKFIIFTAALFIELWVISLYYEFYWTGAAAVFSIGYLLSAMWEAIADLDDPFHGVWRIHLDPPEEAMREVSIHRRWSDRMFERLFGNGNGSGTSITFTK